MNLGTNIREFLKEHNEPFIDKNGARIYEWENDNGVRFRLVSKTQDGGTTADSHPANAEVIITFYSDRNLKNRMKFKNNFLKHNDTKKLN